MIYLYSLGFIGFFLWSLDYQLNNEDYITPKYDFFWGSLLVAIFWPLFLIGLIFSYKREK